MNNQCEHILRAGFSRAIESAKIDLGGSQTEEQLEQYSELKSCENIYK